MFCTFLWLSTASLLRIYNIDPVFLSSVAFESWKTIELRELLKLLVISVNVFSTWLVWKHRWLDRSNKRRNWHADGSKEIQKFNYSVAFRPLSQGSVSKNEIERLWEWMNDPRTILMQRTAVLYSVDSSSNMSRMTCLNIVLKTTTFQEDMERQNFSKFPSIRSEIFSVYGYFWWSAVYFVSILLSIGVYSKHSPFV